jgi:hypothetical protein
MFITRKQLTYENERLERRIEWLTQDLRDMKEEHRAILDFLNIEIKTINRHVIADKKNK